MENRLKKFIIELMVSESDPDTVLKLLIRDYDLVRIVGVALTKNYSIKEVMNILTNEKYSFLERESKLIRMCDDRYIHNYKKLVKVNDSEILVRK